MQRALIAGVFLLPLVCWPSLEQPFSTPKLWLLAALAALALALRPRLEWPWLLWPAAVAVSGAFAPFVSLRMLALALLPLPLAWAVRDGRAPAQALVRALVWASVAQSAIVLLQFARLDPLRLLGWQPEVYAGARMRVYGTLGNPNFVAAWLCGTLPLFASRPALAPLVLAAIFATGSRAFLLAAPAVAVVWIACRARWSKWWLAAIPAAAGLLWFSPARPLAETIRGRLYVPRVVAAHWREIPLAGNGPGAFGVKFAGWQPRFLRENTAERRFAGLFDHAHNDYLEFWVEYGAMGVCALAVAGAWLLRPAWSIGSDIGAWGGLAALLAIALVDFPFHRPAEWALFWSLTGLTSQRRNQSEDLA